MLEGEGLTLEKLELDGALILRAAEGARVSVRGLKVSNAAGSWCRCLKILPWFWKRTGGRGGIVDTTNYYTIWIFKGTGTPLHSLPAFIGGHMCHHTSTFI